VLDVLREGRRHGEAERLLLDLDVDTKLLERRVNEFIELRDRLSAPELERLPAPVGRADDQGVVDVI
jgi:hypothetical protein